jgi:hypothetical protein
VFRSQPPGSSFAERRGGVRAGGGRCHAVSGHSRSRKDVGFIQALPVFSLSHPSGRCGTRGRAPVCATRRQGEPCGGGQWCEWSCDPRYVGRPASCDYSGSRRESHALPGTRGPLLPASHRGGQSGCRGARTTPRPAGFDPAEGRQDKPRQSFRYVFGLISRPYRIIVTL